MSYSRNHSLATMVRWNVLFGVTLSILWLGEFVAKSMRHLNSFSKE